MVCQVSKSQGVDETAWTREGRAVNVLIPPLCKHDSFVFTSIPHDCWYCGSRECPCISFPMVSFGCVQNRLAEFGGFQSFAQTHQRISQRKSGQRLLQVSESVLRPSAFLFLPDDFDDQKFLMEMLGLINPCERLIRTWKMTPFIRDPDVERAISCMSAVFEDLVYHSAQVRLVED